MKTRSIKRLTVFLVVALMVVVLVSSKPTKVEYDNWLGSQVSNLTDNRIAKVVISIIGEPVLDQFTQSQDYVIFNVYKTNYKGYGITTLGILHNFIVIQKTI
jgi:curli biogenesis system outer membrane secretion channel CsgG